MSKKGPGRPRKTERVRFATIAIRETDNQGLRAIAESKQMTISEALNYLLNFHSLMNG
jgi:hypothetical protein